MLKHRCRDYIRPAVWFVVGIVGTLSVLDWRLCPNRLKSDAPLWCSEGPAGGTIHACLPDLSILQMLQTYNDCLNCQTPFPPLGLSPMVPIQKHSLSRRCPFKSNTKLAVSVPDLLTPTPVQGASACSFSLSLSVCLSLPSFTLVLYHETNSVGPCDKNLCCYKEQLVRPNTDQPGKISTEITY